MSVIAIDGFDFADQPHTTGLVTPFLPSCKYTAYNRINASIQPGVVSSPALGGGNSLRFENSGFGNQTYTKLFGLVRPAYCVGFNLNIVDVTGPATPVFRYEAGGATVPGPSGGENGSTALFMEVVRSDNSISIYTGPQGVNDTPGALLWNSAGVYALPLRTWVYVELQVDTDTGTWALFVNDVLLQQQTGASIPPGIDRYSFLSQGFEQHSIDNHYCTDGEQLGPCRVTGFPPNFGSTHQWTPLVAPNVSQIQEFGNRPDLNTPDDNESYVASTAAGTTDYYGFPAPACYGRILALALNVDGSAVTGSPSVDFLIKLAAMEYSAGFSDSYIGGYHIKQGISELNPLTGIFWTDADIAAGLFGMRMAGSGELRVTQFMIEKLVSLRNVPYQCGGGAISYTS